MLHKKFVYIYIYRTSCHKSLLALILRVLASFVNSKTIHQLLTNLTKWEDTNRPTSWMATARTETTRGPTYSMTRAIGATPWQKNFIRRCHCLHCHYSSLTVEVTCHMDRPLQWSHRWACRRECHLIVYTSCKAGVHAGPMCMQKPYRPGTTCMLEIIASLTAFCVAIVHTCRFYFIYCGLRFYAQSHSDNGHAVGAWSCSMFCTCTHSGSPHKVLHSTSTKITGVHACVCV